ncbi:MAG: ankyrin repeat domain-containing protein, partial [Burkholderiaceae bacterium]
MTRLAQVFWAVAAIDALLLIVFLAIALQDRAGQHDGGRAMGMFFFIVVPGAVLAAAMLLFHFSASWPPKSIALFIVIVPGLWFAKVQVEDKLIDRRIEANRRGTGYFETDAMRQMGAAVVQRDVATLQRIGASVDVNTRGREAMTLLRLAVSGSDARTSDGSELPVVRALLALGAHADDAMPVACRRFDAELLTVLLAAGGNPNLRVDDERPLVFDAMSNLTPRNFRLLAEHGLDLNSKSYGDPLAVQLAIGRRWELL